MCGVECCSYGRQICRRYVCDPFYRSGRTLTRAVCVDRLANLISRYEEPSSFARWDSPLITIPWEDVDLPEESLMEAMTKGELRPPNQATIVVRFSASARFWAT